MKLSHVSHVSLVAFIVACPILTATWVSADEPDHNSRPSHDVHHVDCSKGETIADGLRRVNPGDTLVVAGTCSENVVVGSVVHQFDGVTLDGQGTATLVGPDPTLNVLELDGVSGFTIKGLTVSGGFDGISINSGNQVAIDHVAVQGAGRHGIHFQRATTMGFVTNSLVTNNPGNGIVINEGSYVRVGFTSEVGASQGATGPCTVTNNGGFGVRVQRNATARIYVSTISGNSGDGVHVESNSYAEVATDVIDNNGKNGIFVSENSVLHLGNATGTKNEDNPDTGSLNAGFGLAASWGAYVQGRLGTLAGTTGASSFTHNAVSNLTP